MMKRKISRIFGAAAVLICWVLFGGRQEAAANTKARAVELTSQRAESDRITEGEEKWYRISLDSSGTLNALFKADETKLNLRLYDEAGQELNSINAPYAVEGKLKFIYELRKGNYYFCVKQQENTEMTQGGQIFSLTSSFVSAKAKYEKNCSLDQAAKIKKSGKDINGHLAVNAPDEYFRFEVKKTSRIYIYLSSESFQSLSLLNQEGKLLRLGDRYADSDSNDEPYKDFSGDCCIISELLLPGTYYIRVSSETVERTDYAYANGFGAFDLYISWDGFKNGKLTLSKYNVTYTGKALQLPKVTLLDDENGILKPNKNAKLRFRDMATGKIVKSIKDIGRYVVSLDYVGPELGECDFLPDVFSERAIFTVRPERSKVQKLKSTGYKTVTVKAKKNKKCTGVQIQIAADRNFKKFVQTFNAVKATTQKITGLKSGRSYYVRVRNYKDVGVRYTDGTTVAEPLYGEWSKIRSVVCK